MSTKWVIQKETRKGGTRNCSNHLRFGTYPFIIVSSSLHCVQGRIRNSGSELILVAPNTDTLPRVELASGTLVPGSSAYLAYND